MAKEAWSSAERFVLPAIRSARSSEELKTAISVLFLCLFAVFSFTLKTELRREKSPVAALKIGETMPDFTLPDSNGKTVKLSEVSPGASCAVTAALSQPYHIIVTDKVRKVKFKVQRETKECR